jgi:hypothetical protein
LENCNPAAGATKDSSYICPCNKVNYKSAQKLERHQESDVHIINFIFRPISLQVEAVKVVSLQQLSDHDRKSYTIWISGVEQESREAILRERSRRVHQFCIERNCRTELVVVKHLNKQTTYHLQQINHTRNHTRMLGETCKKTNHIISVTTTT